MNTRNIGRIQLSDDWLRKFVPSIFAEEAHSTRSDNYTFVPTHEVLSGLDKLGYVPFWADQTNTRVEDKRAFTKHMVRLRHKSDATGIVVPKELNELVLVNSHDGTSSYQLSAGTFRLVCMNGLIRQDVGNSVRVNHKGNILTSVLEAAEQVVGQFSIMMDERKRFEGTLLSYDEQVGFANKALALRYDVSKEHSPIAGANLLRDRRYQDRGNNLWLVLNRIQENLVRGGLQGLSKDSKRTTTRAITGIDKNININKGLWQLANEFAEV